MISREVPGAAAARFPPAAVPGRGRGWYRIDLHVHSDLSVGADLTPEQVVAEVLARGLDGFASTEHNTADGHGRWASAGTELLVILGQEVVTGTGHWLALGVEPGQVIGSDYRARDAVVGGHVQRVRDGGGLCVVAHPFAPYPEGLFGFAYSQFDAVEVWNGQWSSGLAWQADNETAVADWGRRLIADVECGAWLPAVGGSDAHLAGQVAAPHTVVRADSLATSDVLAGVRAGHAWIAGSAQVGLRVSASCDGATAELGERLRTGGSDVVVRVQVIGVPAGTVTWHTDRGIACRADLPSTGTASTEWTTTAAESALVRVEIRHPDQKMAALTNPIILT